MSMMTTAMAILMFDTIDAREAKDLMQCSMFLGFEDDGTAYFERVTPAHNAAVLLFFNSQEFHGALNAVDKSVTKMNQELGGCRCTAAMEFGVGEVRMWHEVDSCFNP